jgi:uncharacterized phiE125 gp8 family phage protein
MTLVMTNGPALEPVTVAEAKAHLRVDASSEDALIASLIITSRLHVEAALGIALISQAWSYFIDRWPTSGQVSLPLKPVQSVDVVRVWSADSTSQMLSAASYALDGVGAPPRLSWVGPFPPPVAGRTVNGIEIALTAGYGDAAGDVPAPIRQALLLLVAHWYENREPVEIGATDVEIPHMVSALLAPYRARRL